MKLKLPDLSIAEQWKTIYERERKNLVSNAITGSELIEYAKKRLGAEPYENETFQNAVCKDVLNNAFFRKKLNGQDPQPVVLRLTDGTFLGIDRISGWFLAENDAVRCELTVVKGLDEADLDSVPRTVDYLRCKKLRDLQIHERRKRKPKKN